MSTVDPDTARRQALLRTAHTQSAFDKDRKDQAEARRTTAARASGESKRPAEGRYTSRSSDPATRDLSVGGAINKIKSKQYSDQKTIDEASK